MRQTVPREVHGPCDRIAVPFLLDIAAYTRFLLALPLLIIAETILGPRIARPPLILSTPALPSKKTSSASTMR
jgi:hypothetical protein